MEEIRYRDSFRTGGRERVLPANSGPRAWLCSRLPHEEGAGFAGIIERLVAESGKADMAVDRAVPSDTKDWNEALLCARGPTSAPVH